MATWCYLYVKESDRSRSSTDSDVENIEKPKRVPRKIIESFEMVDFSHPRYPMCTQLNIHLVSYKPSEISGLSLQKLHLWLDFDQAVQEIWIFKSDHHC